MKKVLIGSLICTNLLFANIPESINFHSIAFNDSGNALANTTIAVKIELLNSSSSALYVETNSSVTTDSKGLFTLKIGTQTATTGVFSQLNFSEVAKIKVSADLSGGTNYIEMGTQEFSTVPFAFVAKSLEGNNTVADQEDMIAIGKYNTANNTDALFVVGNGTSTSSRSDAFVVYGDGNVSVEQNLTVGGKLFVNGTEVTSASSSTILNSNGTTATGTNALAWGKETNASGYASTAWGYKTLASGFGSTAWGKETNASKIYSTAFGERTMADQTDMMAIGVYNTADNTDALFAVGNGTSDTSRSDAFVVYGDGNVSVEENLTVGGKLFVNGTEVTPASSATVLNSSSTTATGTNALAWGSGTKALGYISTAWGDSTKASQNYSTAWGQSTIASGYASTTWGQGTVASVDFSTAWGEGTVADQASMTAIGKYNTENNTNALFVVGNGSDINSRSDVFEVFSNGDVSVTGKLLVNGTEVTPASSSAILNSVGTTASTILNALAWGKGTTASTTAATAWGDTTTASASYSTAWGQSTTASGGYSTAWGQSTTASGNYSTAWGSGTVADQSSMTAIGKYNTENNTNALFVVGNGSSSNIRSDAFKVDTSGNITYAGTSTQSSDERLKTNIKKIVNSIEKVKGINGVTYNWIDENKEQSTQVGVIAQDVQRVMPELVREGNNGYLSVSYTSMVGLLVEAIKEQQKEIEEKEEKINKIIKALNSAGITIEE